MTVTAGSSIATSGLVFEYDMSNTRSSWMGKPTTNYAYDQNPRIDSSYANYSATATGTWNTKHIDALRVYNDNGSEITGYVNTGVGDWTNTYHAIWTYDTELERPVVTMRDIDGQWKAKNWGLGQTYSSMGLGAGSTYTISWLSWTTDLTKAANAGIYSPNSGGSYNFWDGQSNSFSTALNTKTYTWQRVYATFTVSAGLNYAGGLNVYMYGHYGNRGTVKIADVQIETGTASGFSKIYSRTSTQSILDLTNSNIVTNTSLTYASDNTFTFNGSNNYATISTFTNKPTSAITCESWIKPTKGSVGTGTIRGASLSCTNSMYLGIIDSIDGGSTFALHWANQTSINRINSWQGNIPNNAWSHIVGTYDGATMRAYLNGVEVYSAAQTGTIPDGTYVIGTYGGGLADGVHNFNGSLPVGRIYNRGLTAAEVKQNFYALRGRYGI